MQPGKGGIYWNWNIQKGMSEDGQTLKGISTIVDSEGGKPMTKAFIQTLLCENNFQMSLWGSNKSNDFME